jgi:hypothetical protein
MTTIQKSIKIPEDRRLHLDLTLPEDFPAGQAKILISPSVETEPPAPLPELAGRQPEFRGRPNGDSA